MLKFQKHHHQLSPLTLTPRYFTSSLSSPSVLTTLICIFITILATMCCSSDIAYAKMISHSTSNLKGKSCLESEVCRDPHKECMFGECQCKSYFDYIPEHDLCAKSYGASCSTFFAGELCNTNKFLACDEEDTCSCVKEGDSFLIYDQYLESCVAPPGHQCELIGFTNIMKECVRNASCVEDSNRTVDKEFFGICECNSGFVEKGEKCVPELGSKCVLDGDCDQEGMQCVQGTCQCSNDRVYCKNEHECKLKVGKMCEVSRTECVENAKCHGETGKNPWHWDWRCACKLGYQVYPQNGTCVRDNHHNCPISQVYDVWKGRCSDKVGEECLSDGMNLCVKHAFCGTGNKCQCFEGYAATENGTCAKKIDQVTEVEGREDISTISPQPYEYTATAADNDKRNMFPEVGNRVSAGDSCTNNGSASARLVIICSVTIVIIFKMFNGVGHIIAS